MPASTALSAGGQIEIDVVRIADRQATGVRDKLQPCSVEISTGLPNCRFHMRSFFYSHYLVAFAHCMYLRSSLRHSESGYAIITCQNVCIFSQPHTDDTFSVALSLRQLRGHSQAERYTHRYADVRATRSARTTPLAWMMSAWMMSAWVTSAWPQAQGGHHGRTLASTCRTKSLDTDWRRRSLRCDPGCLADLRLSTASAAGDGRIGPARWDSGRTATRSQWARRTDERQHADGRHRQSQPRLWGVRVRSRRGAQQRRRAAGPADR